MYFLGLSLPALALCVLGGGVLGLSGYTFHYAEGGSYFSNDPRACVNCHVMREAYDGWQKASHHTAAACNDCHVPQQPLAKLAAKAENGFWHSKGFTLQDFAEPIRIKPKNAEILQANCIRCHGELVGDILAHGPPGTPLNNCVRCHPSVGHGPPR
jgi:cytochrome c nitrite reductase small subunit